MVLYQSSIKNIIKKLKYQDNSTLRYECDETFSDECEFAAFPHAKRA